MRNSDVFPQKLGERRRVKDAPEEAGGKVTPTVPEQVAALIFTGANLYLLTFGNVIRQHA